MKLNRRDTLGFGAALALGALYPAAATGCRLFPRDSVDRFAAFQDGAEVGARWYAFSRGSGRFVVESGVDLRYGVGAGRTTTYFHRARETWRQGWLDGFSATTRYPDREIRIEAVSVEHGILSVTSSESDVNLQVSGYVVPSNLWHRDSRLVNRLIDLTDGRVKLVKAFYAGKDVLPRYGGITVGAHYRVRGELNLDAWYGDDCQLLRLLVPLRNASPLRFELLPAA